MLSIYKLRCVSEIGRISGCNVQTPLRHPITQFTVEHICFSCGDVRVTDFQFIFGNKILLFIPIMHLNKKIGFTQG